MLLFILTIGAFLFVTIVFLSSTNPMTNLSLALAIFGVALVGLAVGVMADDVTKVIICELKDRREGILLAKMMTEGKI